MKVVALTQAAGTVESSNTPHLAQPTKTWLAWAPFHLRLSLSSAAGPATSTTSLHTESIAWNRTGGSLNYVGVCVVQTEA